MGKDVDKIKKLLSQGYQISEHSFSMHRSEKNENKEIHTIKVLLAKGDLKQNIESSNDDDLFSFLTHFVKMKDQFDNYHFVYVDDPQTYQHIDHKNLPPSYVDKHEIWIGSRKFDKGILLTLLAKPKSGIIICEFYIDYAKNPSLHDVDLKDVVSVIDKKSNKKVFGGYVDHSYTIHSSQFFACAGGTKFFSHEKTTIIASGIPPMELADFVGRSTGHRIKFDEQIKPKSIPRNFIVIMPLGNLTLQENITIANTTIYHKLDSEEDHLIRTQDVAYQDPDWNGNNLRIRTKVSATNYFDAIQKGYQKISVIVDCMAFRSDFSYPKYTKNGLTKEVRFSCYRYFSRIKVYPKIFCKEISSNSYIFFNLRTMTENQLVFDHGAKNFFNLVNELFEELLLKDPNTLTQEKSSILSSCHWLRLGIFCEDLFERLIYLYNSLEFAISGISTPKLFSNSELEQIKQKVEILKLSDLQNNKIKNRISELNNTSLFEKIEHFCNENNISITEKEWDTIRSTRTKRNSLIHGKKDILVIREELEKLQTVIEKILLAKLK